MSIPKIIHYCWFGGSKKPSIIKKCIKSWKKYCPDYEIIEWNETNFDVNCNEYCKSAYEAKKWAFVTDYVRLKVLYDNGGIYMDTDVELVKSLDDLLDLSCFIGFQHEKYVSNGLVVGAGQHHNFIKENADVYENYEGDFIICQEITTALLKERGLEVPCDGTIQNLDDICVFPPEYFCPYDIRDYSMNKTENTYAIHHFTSSWWDEKSKKSYRSVKRKVKIDYYLHAPNRLMVKLLGEKRYSQLKQKINRD